MKLHIKDAIELKSIIDSLVYDAHEDALCNEIENIHLKNPMNTSHHLKIKEWKKKKK